MKKRYIFLVMFFIIIFIGASIGYKAYNKYNEILAQDYFYLNEVTETTELQDYNMYGETLNMKINDSLENEVSFIKSSEEHEVVAKQQTQEEVDKGVILANLEDGNYYMQVDGKLVTSPDVNLDFYTVTRDGKNSHVTLEPVMKDVIKIEKKEETLPDDVCDIMIDPGHGGIDVGGIGLDGQYESDLALSISLLLKTELENLGYKVCMTRETNINPGNLPGIEEAGAGSRTSMPIEQSAKYYISMHYNSGGGNGYEIYSSVRTTSTFGHYISEEMQKNATPSQNMADYFVEREDAVAKRPLGTEEHATIDYLYSIREVGGKALPSTSEKNPDAESVYGSEALLIEAGYLDDETNYYLITDDTYQQEMAHNIAVGFDNYIKNR